MNFYKICFYVFFSFLIFIEPFNLHAASTVDVSPSDSSSTYTYNYLDQLIAHHLIHTAIVGQRPYSREEVARLILEAKKNWKIKKENLKSEAGQFAQTQKRIEDLLDFLQKDYEKEIIALTENKRELIQLFGLRDLDFSLMGLTSESKVFPVENGVGVIDATVNPLVHFRQGRHYSKGGQFAFETSHSLNLSKYSSFYFRPRFEVQFPTNSEEGSQVKLYPQEYYGVFNIHNFEIQMGRSSLVEGQGENGGIILSDNARALDHIQISNDHPIFLPWVFKYLGPTKFMAFYENMGPENFFPYSHHFGYKISLKPFSFWEIGLLSVSQMGGQRGPGLNAVDVIANFVGVADTDRANSNRQMSLDTRLTFSRLRNTQLYAEFAWEDDPTSQWVNGNLRKAFIDDMAYYAGVYIPRLNDSGTLQGRFEFKYISERFFRHGQFQSGFTLNKNILGDPLGPDAKGVRGNLKWNPNLRTLLDWNFYYETSDSNTYTGVGDKPGDLDKILLVQDNPSEKRFRATMNYKYQINERVLLRANIGYERVLDFNYISGSNKNNFLGEVGLTYNFGNHFTYFSSK